MTLLRITFPVLLVTSAVIADEEAGIEYFEDHIEPVLMDHCYRCHSSESEEPAGGLLLDTRRGIREGGETGPAVVPNDLEESLLVSAIHYEDLEMPPEEMLDEETIQHFETWIQMGAPDPREDNDSDSADPHWASVAVVRPKVPEVKDDRWPLNAIDNFILRRLEEAELRPAAEASIEIQYHRLCRILISRTPEESEGIPDQQTLDKRLDELLVSESHATLRAVDWINQLRAREDIAQKTHLRYFLYVSDAFRKDKPFNQFINEQLANDLLPEGMRGKPGALLFLDRGSVVASPNPASRLQLIGRIFTGRNLLCTQCHDDQKNDRMESFLSGLTGGSSNDAPPQQKESCVGMPTGFPALTSRNARLKLAQWITQPTNPYTARVIANSVWQEAFGRGLVDTESGFAPTTDPPTHPELLDWLAWQLVHEHKWSRRKLLKQVLQSATWRQAETAQGRSDIQDPDNLLYGRSTWHGPEPE